MGNLLITIALWFGATMLTAWLDRREMTDRSLLLWTVASYAVAALVSAFVYRDELRRLLQGGYDKVSFTLGAVILFGAIVGGIGAGWLYVTVAVSKEVAPATEVATPERAESGIRPRIAALGVGPLPEKAGIIAYASLEVSITNSGTPQSLDHYELTATLAGGSSVKGISISIPENGIEIDYPNGTVVLILRDESLDDRTLTPIPTNGTVRGRLLFGFPENSDQLREQTTAFVLTMRDISGNQYSTPAFSIRPGKTGPDSNLPGLRPHYARPK